MGSTRAQLIAAVVAVAVIIATSLNLLIITAEHGLGSRVAPPAPKIATGNLSRADRFGRGTTRMARPNSVIYDEAQPSFVTRSGSQLLLDGQPYRFTGLNIYNANNTTDCWYTLGSGPDFDSALTAIGAGQKVFRAWFFQYSATTNGQRDWSAFDHTLMVARAHGERVIATLGNHWADCEGGPSQPYYKTESWYGTGYRTLVTPGLAKTYRDWVAEVVARYRDNPTILAWQLMNEASTPSDSRTGACTSTAAATLHNFAADMSTVVKGIDPQHLLSLGTVGGGECGVAGGNYQFVYSVPGIDLCEVHDYGPPTASMPNGLQTRIAQCRALNKPLFDGEVGIQVAAAGSFASRAADYQAKLSAQFQAGVVGGLIWDWCGANQVAYSGYEISPGDPALQVLTLY